MAGVRVAPRRSTLRVWVYPCGVLVGGTKQRHFDGTSLEPENCLKTRRLSQRSPGARTGRDNAQDQDSAEARKKHLIAGRTCGAYPNAVPAYFAGGRVHIIPVLVRDAVLGAP